MPATVKKVGRKWVVYSHAGGRKLGSHATKKKAQAQQRAVNRPLSRKRKR